MAENYAIIRLGNKQHRVRDGETLVVDRLRTEPGTSFEPDVLLGEGAVTATVVAHERGPKIRIGKYRRRTGYKRHNGHRSATSRVQISIGAAKRSATAKQEAPAGVPDGYDELTVPDIREAAAGWDNAQLEAALAYEQGHAGRKGAIAALASALAKG